MADPHPYKCCWCGAGFDSIAVRDAHERSCEVPKQ